MKKLMLALSALLFTMTACTAKKRDNALPYGAERNLLKIADYDGKEFDVITDSVETKSSSNSSDVKILDETGKIQNQNYEDGVYFVALAPLRTYEHIVPAIAEALTLRFQSDNRSAKQQLLDYLRHQQVLLVLDNFEHLQAGAELILELLEGCPSLRLLVTSRERLQLSSETLFVLESMALPAFNS